MQSKIYDHCIIQMISCHLFKFPGHFKVLRCVQMLFLQDAGKEIYAADLYLGHVYVSADGLNIFLGTDK